MANTTGGTAYKPRQKKKKKIGELIASTGLPSKTPGTARVVGDRPAQGTKPVGRTRGKSPLASFIPPANTAKTGPRKGQAFDVVHRDGKRFHRYTKADGTKQYVADEKAPKRPKAKLFGVR